MAELFRQARDELGPERGGGVFLARESRGEPVEGNLEAAFANPGCRAWVGTVTGVVVGYLAGRVEDLRDGRRLGVVDDVYVEPGARAVGVGEAMMDLALGWYRDEGCFGVDAMALPGM